MRRNFFIFWLVLLSGGTAWPAEYRFGPADWPIEAQFVAQPATDVILTPSPQGEVKASRYFLEQDGEHYLLIRFAYPLALTPGTETGLYAKSRDELMRSRPGQVRAQEQYWLGPYAGKRLLLAQPKEKTLRELRLLVIGASLYVLSAEWPAQGPGAGHAAAFFGSIKLRADCEDARAVQTRERWREFTAGQFKVRYDATRWYRDPADEEPGICNFLRADKTAEAQFIAEADPVAGGDIAAAVLKTARDGAEQVSVLKRGQKMRGLVQVTELEFTATVEHITYINHGYFYSGPEGTVQLRGWARDQDYRTAQDDIGELLDGLTIGGPSGTSAGAH